MTASQLRNPDERIATLIWEIERWNRQINLVSRVNTPRRVASLVAQCEVGWELVAAALEDVDWLDSATYFDLGSGAGLPGLVWAAVRARLGHAGAATLVEPRDKRAWFLRRTARMMSLPAVSVVAERWGEGQVGVSDVGVLVSLKALRMEDGVILEGLARYGESRILPRDVAIVRFLDPIQHTREWLEERFAAPDRPGAEIWIRTGVESLGEGDPRLLLTRYRLA